MCNKPECWSTNHSLKERRNAYSNFFNKPYFQNLLSTTAKYQSFLAECGGVEEMTEYNHDDIDQLLFE